MKRKKKVRRHSQAEKCLQVAAALIVAVSDAPSRLPAWRPGKWKEGRFSFTCAMISSIIWPTSDECETHLTGEMVV